jgi:lambda repressor-like predicted transcriptional regulator
MSVRITIQVENNLRKAMGPHQILWLSERTGLHRNTISSLLKGAMPRLDNAYIIAVALNKSVEEIWPFLKTEG